MCSFFCGGLFFAWTGKLHRPVETPFALSCYLWLVLLPCCRRVRSLCVSCWVLFTLVIYCGKATDSFIECRNITAVRWKDKYGYTDTAVQGGRLEKVQKAVSTAYYLSVCLCLLLETCSQNLRADVWTRHGFPGKTALFLQSTGGKEAIFMLFHFKRTLLINVVLNILCWAILLKIN